MDPKTLYVLEYHKVLEHLAANCDFSASAELARALEPTTSYDLAKTRLQETTEARHLLSTHDISIGGAHDIREQVQHARRGGVLEPQDLLDVKATLISCRELKKTLEKYSRGAVESSPGFEPASPTGSNSRGGNSPKTESAHQPHSAKRRGKAPEVDSRPYIYPRLAEMSLSLPQPGGLVDVISRTISDRGEVLDSASPKLSALRGQLKVAHDRLMTRLQRYITDSQTVPMLQDTLITQRDGRYVIPLRAEFKGQIKSIVHDQSSSGATLFVEPLAVVELNNEYREIQMAERNEIIRILAEVSAQVGMSAGEIISGVDALAELDLAFAKAKYADEIRANEPILHAMSKVKSQVSDLRPSTFDGPTIKLYKARHPLIDLAHVVSNDIELAPGTRAVVITGPNTGGKTVSLKTVGLMVLMAQSGLHIPAQSGSELSMFQDVFADIGDEQSIEQSLSTFSGHITNIIRILKQIDARSLVMFDELGAGTDPQEGAALARAILMHLLETGCTTFVATHYPELKTFAHGTDGVVNASLEFDVQTLRPTYRLTIGLPGRSNALAIAARLGLPESIITTARNEVNPDELRADKLLDDIRKERNRTSREREKVEKVRQRHDQAARELEKRLEAIEDERREVIARAKAEAELEVEVLKRNIGRLKAELKKVRQPLDALERIEEKVEVVEEKVAAPVERKTLDGRPVPVSPPTVNRPLSLGEKVILKTLGSEGIITSLGEAEAEVQVGALRIRAKLGDIQRKTAEDAAKPEEKPSGRERRIQKIAASMPTTAATLGHNSPGLELDLRGMMSEDALAKLDDYLDKAYLSGLPYVRIIHGKGTGKLRQVVREMLKGHPHVATFEIGLESEGGDGVTVAKMIKE
jgi:DNA mismatch repair protein MutS2